MKKKLLSMFVAICLVLTSVPSLALANNNVSYKDAMNQTKSFITKNLKNPGLNNGDWMVLGLARSGAGSNDQLLDTYYNNVVKSVKAQKGELHHVKYTEYSRTILLMSALGKNPAKLGGYNMLAKLADLNMVKKQGLNGPIWALIALDSNNYKIPVVKGVKNQTTRDKLINTILDAQLQDGGFALSGTKADPDMTGMAIQALAKYYNDSNYPKVKKAVDKALESIKFMQKANGGFASWGTHNSESCSQIIVALTALGIDPEKDSRFVRNGNSAVDALLDYYVAGGGFKHIEAGKIDYMATEQAFYALTAYQRLLDGKTALYDMTDVSADAEKPQSPAKPAKPVITSVKSPKAKTVVVKWKSPSKDADGYQLRLSPSKKFSPSKVVTVSKDATSKSVGKLKKGKTYFVKVRAYKVKEDGSKLFGGYSAVKKVKVK